MSDASSLARNIRQRVSGTTEERLGRALSDLLENPLLTGAIGRAFEAREKATQAQEVALGALNIPSAADIERLTRRLRSVSHRLEGIEDGVERLDRALAPARSEGSDIDQRLTAIEERLGTLTERLSSDTTAGHSALATGTGAAKTAANTASRAGRSTTEAKSRAGVRTKSAPAAGTAKSRGTSAGSAGVAKAKPNAKPKAKPKRS